MPVTGEPVLTFFDERRRQPVRGPLLESRLSWESESTLKFERKVSFARE
jgi:hypothetical protein